MIKALFSILLLTGAFIYIISYILHISEELDFNNECEL